MSRKTMIWAGSAVLVVAALAAGWFVFHKPEREYPPEAARAAPSPDEAIVLPDALDKNKKAVPTQHVLVSEEKKEQKRARVTGYIQDDKLPSGTLRGVCYVPFDKAVALYPPLPVELTGANAIRDPQAGEAEYFANRPPLTPVWLGPYYQAKRRYGVRGALVIVKAVAAGRARRLDRISLLMDYRSHYLVAQKPQGNNVFNPSWFTIGVTPPGELIQLLNLSLYGDDVLLKRAATGELVQKIPVRAYADARYPKAHYGTNPDMQEPPASELPRLRESGLYTLESERHPWRNAWLYVAENPYVTLSDSGGRGREDEALKTGAFVIPGIPPGKYTVEVWHPECEPVSRTREVEILPDADTELAVAFKPPPILTAPPLYPAKPVLEYAFLGPLDPTDEAASELDPQKPNFGAAYPGKYDCVQWEKVVPPQKDANAGWLVLKSRWEPKVEAKTYAAVRFDSPTAQRLSLRVWIKYLAAQFFLNGKPIYYTVDPLNQWGFYETGDESVVMTGDLKPGENILLVRLLGPTSGGYGGNNSSGLCMNYGPETVAAKAPEITATAVAKDEDKSSVILTDSAYWRTFVTRGPLRLNPRLLKDESYLATRRDLSAGLARIEAGTKSLLMDRNVDWQTADWRDRALWFPFGIYYQSFPMIAMVSQAPPPADWFQPNFNDGEWMMSWNTPVPDPQTQTGFLVWNRYLRGEFVVPENVQPGDLKLNVTYHGGARVFVNGVEVARGHLPASDGPGAVAEEYPVEAYLARPEEQAKSPLPRQVPDLKTSFLNGGKDNSKELERFRTPGGKVFITRECWDRIRKLRDRELSATVPARLLRKGRNVVAVEIRGSFYHPDVWNAGWGQMDAHLHWAWWEGGYGLSWAHAELLGLELKDPAGAIPSAMEPLKAGLQAWAEDMHTRVLDVHARPAASPAGTVRMVGALNGTYSGIAVVRSSAGIEGLKAAVSDLKAAKGPGAIPASRLTVAGMQGRPLDDLRQLDAGGRESNVSAAYLRAAAIQASFSPVVPKRGRTEDWSAWFNKVLARVLFYDQITRALPERVPANVSQPLWLSLKVPLETEPGLYRGALTVSAQGLDPVTVPVEAEIIGWRVPNPVEFKTDTWLEQHPYAIANHYLLPKNADAKPGERNWEGPVKAKVPLWSDEHFRLMEPSFALLGRAGNDVVHVPVVVRTEFGNYQDSPIRWIRKKDGSLAFDYAFLDRYLDLACKYLGHVRVVDFVVVHCQYSASPSSVMVLDETTGKNEEWNIGWNADALTRLNAWKTFASALLKHMGERYPDSRVYWGHPGDFEPDPGLMSYLFEVFPGTYWAASGHCYSGGAGGGGHSRNIVRCFSDVYGAPKPYKSAMGWKGPAIGNWGAGITWGDANLLDYKTYRADETYLYVHNPRDYCTGGAQPIRWRTLPAQALRRGYSGVGRVGLDSYDKDWMSGFRGNDWGFPGRSCNMLSWPGPDGAESSARFEALLEGVQETEARIFLEQSLDRGYLDKALSEEAQQALDDHVRPVMMNLGFRDGAAEEYLYPWQSCSRQLMIAAAKAAEVVGVDINQPDVALRVPALGLAKRSFKLRNWTGKPRAWKATVSAPWIVPERTDGTLLGFEDFAFVVDGKALKPGGTVKGEIVITDTANGHASKFDVTAAVEPPILVTYEHPHFNVTCGRSETREFRIVNRAVTPQDWQLAASVPWIKIEPAAGTLQAGEERNLRVTATPPDKQAVYENRFTLKAAGGLADGTFLSKTFVIPILREKEDRAMPEGKIIKIEDMSKQFKSGVFCKNGTIIESGAGVREWGAPRTQTFTTDRAMYITPSVALDNVGSAASYILLIGKEKFSRGIWVTPHFEAVYNLQDTGITAFSAYVGITRDARERQIRHHQYRANFEIRVDGEVRTQSGLMTPTDDARYLTVENLRGAKEIMLVTRLDCDKDDPTYLCTWADAQFYAERETAPAKTAEKK